MIKKVPKADAEELFSAVLTMVGEGEQDHVIIDHLETSINELVEYKINEYRLALSTILSERADMIKRPVKDWKMPIFAKERIKEAASFYSGLSMYIAEVTDDSVESARERLLDVEGLE